MPAFKAKEEGKKEGPTPILEPNRNSLALMQTVVMSFARNLYLGRPDLPIDHVHVCFPVQVVHKVVERCIALNMQDVTPDEGKRYKHNTDNEANNPYIIARAYEGQRTAANYSSVPPTTQLAEVYEHGILDGSFGQMMSFASSYKSNFRIEVPLWHKVEEGVAPPGKDQRATAPLIMAQPVLPNSEPSPDSCNDTLADVTAFSEQEVDDAEEEEIEDDTYLTVTGQGCFSFHRSLLQRAAQTYSKRIVSHKYQQISKWLLTGFAVAISRKNWHLLSKNRTCTVTRYRLLRTQFQQGYLADEEDKKAALQYAAPHAKSLCVETWEKLVSQLILKGYYEANNAFEDVREAHDQLDFYATTNQDNPVRGAPEVDPRGQQQAPDPVQRKEGPQ